MKYGNEQCEEEKGNHSHCNFQKMPDILKLALQSKAAHAMKHPVKEILECRVQIQKQSPHIFLKYPKRCLQKMLCYVKAGRN